MKLYELSNTYQHLIDLANSADDDADFQAFADTLESLDGEIVEKVLNCAAVVKTLNAQEEVIDAERKRLAIRGESISRSVAMLKTRMQQAMELAQKDKIKGELFTVSIQKNPPKVALDVDDPTKLPPEFQRVTVAPNLSAIGETLKAGTPVDGAHLEYTKSLRIR